MLLLLELLLFVSTKKRSNYLKSLELENERHEQDCYAGVYFVHSI